MDTYWSDHSPPHHVLHPPSDARGDRRVRRSRPPMNRYLAAREESPWAEKAARRPQTLMDIATIGAKVLKRAGASAGN
ncbi:MAG: hypothetical protein ACLUNZ_12520 [Evtepia sp.]